jgi:hypothetical protein
MAAISLEQAIEYLTSDGQPQAEARAAAAEARAAEAEARAAEEAAVRHALEERLRERER